MESKTIEDKVNNPKHYQGLDNLYIMDGSGNYIPAQVIDVIKALTANLDGVCAFDIGNALKYLGRAGKKEGDEKADQTEGEKQIEDWSKACWYINHAVKEKT